MKTNNQRTESILRKFNQKKEKQKIIKTTVLSLALVCVTAFSFVLFTPYAVQPTAAEKYKDSEYHTVICAIDGLTPKPTGESYKNNFEKWSSQLINSLFAFGGKNAAGDMNAMPPPTDDEVAEDITQSGAGYVETTDNQVDGVIEGDLFKRTSTHIFYLDMWAHTLRVYSIAGENSQPVATFPIDMQGGSMVVNHQPQIYLSADGTRLTLLMSVSKANKTDKWARYTVAVGYDVSDPTDIKEIDRVYLSGDFVSSRMTNGSLLLINDFSVAGTPDFENKQSFLPYFGSWKGMQPVVAEDIICPENATVKRYTVLCEIDPETFTVNDCTALFSHTSEAFVSKENIFVTRSFTEKEQGEGKCYTMVSKTEISCVYYGGEGLEYKGSATVNGSVKNQYSMDEYNGVLRVVTTTTEEFYEGVYREEFGVHEGLRQEMTQGGSLYCIDLASFEVVASVENFIVGETVESVRFDKEKAYVCTAVVVTLKDPVFVFDLTDLSNITFVDTGTIKGYSTSLVNFKDGYLLGIGYGETRGFKAEIYVETETGVESVCVYEDDGNFSEDYKSYYINREKGLVGLCVGGNYLLLVFDGYGFNVLVHQSLPTVSGFNLIRATLIDGYFYVIGAGENNFMVVELYS